MIGILGGSFDPIHIGHLRLALELYEDLGLQQVRLIPSGLPPHRAPPVASPTQRLYMLKAALIDAPGLYIDERELARSGPSYTIDTLTSLRAELGGVPLCLILGMDAFLSLNTWRRWREIITLAHIIVAQRPGYDARISKNEARSLPGAELASLIAERRTTNPQELANKPAGCILYWPVTQLDISSAHIRALIAAGKSPRYLVPDAVAVTIKSQGIYSNEVPTKEAAHAKN